MPCLFRLHRHPPTTQPNPLLHTPNHQKPKKKGDLEKFKLGALVAYFHVVISYPSILATWHAYNSVTFPYAKVQAPCMNDNVIYVYMYMVAACDVYAGFCVLPCLSLCLQLRHLPLRQGAISLN